MAKAALSKAKDRTPVPISFGMVSRLWLSHLLAGANFLHRLELAQAAACATIKPAAHIVEDGDDIHRAELRNARFIAEFSFGAEAGAARSEERRVGKECVSTCRSGSSA